MSELLNESCPVSGVKVNENVVRAIALYTVIITTVSLYFNLYALTFLLSVDFAIRAFTDGEYSVLRQLGLKTVSVLNIKAKPVDAAPKKFAALLGYLFSINIFVFQFFDIAIISQVLGFMLVVCALLEGVLGFCVGCVVYYQIERLKKIKFNFFSAKN